MFWRSAIVSLLLVAFAGCTETAEQSRGQSEAPNFSLKDLSGKTVQLSEFRGKPVLIDFWATWCPPCLASIPEIEKLHKSYADKGFVILAVSLDEGTPDSIKSFQKEYGMSYTVLQATEDVVEKYGVRSIPMLVLLDKKGRIQRRYLGAGNEEAIEAELKKLM